MSKKKAKAANNGPPGAQIAALPDRIFGGQLEILVLTSRQIRRAVVPKGWPMKNRKPWKAAQIEARSDVPGATQLMRMSPAFGANCAKQATFSHSARRVPSKSDGLR